MKRTKSFKRVCSFALALLLMAGMLAVHAAAAEVSTVTVELRPNVTIMVDGTERTFYNVQGQEVHAIHYNGTHYLPVRAIGELMGKNVNWDGQTRTITLSSPRTAASTRGTPDTRAKVQDISAELRPDFTIVVDGVRRTFSDAQGNAVYPLLHNGTNYLPVRAIGELMGKTVSWNGQTRTITLSAPVNDGLVTDADTFSPTQPSQLRQSGGSEISAAEAKSEALAHAGLSKSQVTFVKQKLDWDNGRRVYEIAFYTKDHKEYDYDIDACTGAVVSFDYDAEDDQRPNSSGNANTSGSYIGEEKAKSIALNHADVSAGSASRLRCELDRDDGRWEYSVEFVSGTTEYEYEIDAVTGNILSRDVDSIYD